VGSSGCREPAVYKRQAAAAMPFPTPFPLSSTFDFFSLQPNLLCPRCVQRPRATTQLSSLFNRCPFKSPSQHFPCVTGSLAASCLLLLRARISCPVFLLVVERYVCLLFALLLFHPKRGSSLHLPPLSATWPRRDAQSTRPQIPSVTIWVRLAICIADAVARGDRSLSRLSWPSNCLSQEREKSGRGRGPGRGPGPGPGQGREEPAAGAKPTRRPLQKTSAAPKARLGAHGPAKPQL